ncbi:MAG TPA: hypothetical protein VGZ00_11090 [Candidatus Baltobacteraceae bacterium]|jgi:virulence-associated protein VapD|nr:hypothetical protein [Candidatus Baltobacteraceae bacterium]
MKALENPDFASLLLASRRLPPTGNVRIYAITLDLDTDTLQRIHPSGLWRNAYSEVKQILIEEGFIWQQGSVYFGDPEKIDAVKCILAAQRLAEDLPWFAESVRDIRMLRIEENNDLARSTASKN